MQRGEGIIRYFGMRAGDDREEGGFARIGLADEADIRDELEVSLDRASEAEQNDELVESATVGAEARANQR